MNFLYEGKKRPGYECVSWFAHNFLLFFDRISHIVTNDDDDNDDISMNCLFLLFFVQYFFVSFWEKYKKIFPFHFQ